MSNWFDEAMPELKKLRNGCYLKYGCWTEKYMDLHFFHEEMRELKQFLLLIFNLVK